LLLQKYNYSNIITSVNFEWDEKKNRTNKEKHHIGFEEALYVFADPFAVVRPDTYDKEDRQQILGQILGVVMVLVVFTSRKDDREDSIRIISARKATQAERRLYEKGNWF
jgi:hypothetical protein